MKSLLSTLVLLFVVSYGLAQTTNSSITELLATNEYPNDPQAEAIVVYDYGETKFIESDTYGFVIYFTRKCRVKIFSEAGLDYTEITIPLYFNATEIEEVSDFKSTTYNIENNLITEVHAGVKDLFEEKINNNWIQKKITVPGAKAGSVFDFEYTIISPFLFNLQDWQFQQKIPVLYSKYTARMIPFFSYNFITLGTNKFDEFSAEESTGLSRNTMGIEYHDMVYQFGMKNLPAFRDDDFITAASDYMVKIDFQLSKIANPNGSKRDIMTTWPKVITELNKNPYFGQYLNTCKIQAKKIIKSDFPVATANTETLDRIVQYVKINFNWDENSGFYANKTAKKFFNEKSGNCGNINLFLVALLRQAGINANPVIISTRGHGRVYSSYPFLHFFNYVIVLSEIDGKMYLSDATNRFTAFDQLPERCINDNGLIVDKEVKTERWLSTAVQKLSEENHSFIFRFGQGIDTVYCTFSYLCNGFDAITNKELYHQHADQYFDEAFGKLFGQMLKTKLPSSENDKTFRCHIDGIVPHTKAGQFVSIKPFLDAPVNSNPFNRSERRYPVDMIYPRQRNYKAIIQLPENAVLHQLPEKYEVNNKLYSFSYHVTEEEGNITVDASYQLKNAVYEATAYARLQSFFDVLIKTLNQNIQIKVE